VEALYEIIDLSSSTKEKLAWLTRAAQSGHPTAQHELATAYHTGLYYDLVPTDVLRSLILEYFSALSGYPLAHMGMGYRYLTGDGVPQSCEKAVTFYEFAANAALKQIEDRGYELYVDRTRLGEKVDRVSRSTELSTQVYMYLMTALYQCIFNTLYVHLYIYIHMQSRCCNITNI
jgi:hypothetical protein